jgi:hypothetical protein
VKPNPRTHVHELVERLFNAVLNSLLADLQKQRILAGRTGSLLAAINGVELILGKDKTT